MSMDGALVLLLVLVLGNYWVGRSVLYPPFLFCSMWLLDLGLLRMEVIYTDPVHPNTVTLLAVGSVLFTAGGTLAMLCPENLIKARFVLSRFPARNKVIKFLLIAFLFCGIPLLWRNLVGMASSGVGDTIFQRARTGGVSGDAVAGSPILAYFVLWSFYAAPLFLIERRDKSFWLMTFIAFAAGILTTGRLPLLMLISALTCVHLLTTNRHTFRDALKF